GSIVFDNSASNATTLSGSVTLAANTNLSFAQNLVGNGNNLTFTGTSPIVVSGNVQLGAGALTKNGSSTLTLTGTNTSSGAIVINAGTLNIQNGAALGTTAGATVVADGAALQLQGNITIGAEALALSGTGAESSGALRNISGTNVFGGSLTLNTATRINSDSGLLTLGGTLSAADLGVTFGGAGDITASGVLALGTLNVDALRRKHERDGWDTDFERIGFACRVGCGSG
ncbi:MAG: hypothetical protein EBR81_16550, partial [Proteobacteria bacterium]|nr:hypothetical protein [Pseudomonadota bacterium]